ncbi:MAG: hypothetical protein ABL907_11970 [Hyphomicrobium sp.]
MARFTTKATTGTVNFAAGVALLVMLFPVHGKLPEKPAGVRTAIEMIAKKPSLRAVTIDTAAAA